MSVYLGKTVPSLEPRTATRLGAADPRVLLLDRAPWLLAHLEEQLGAKIIDPSPGLPESVTLKDWHLQRPGAILGKSGGGKTRVSVGILCDQFKADATSVCLQDFKGEMVEIAGPALLAAGLRPYNLHVIGGATTGRLARYNPFLNPDVSLVQLAGDLLPIIERLTSGPAPRMRDLAANLIVLHAAHGLSFYEIVRSLQRPEYLNALAELPAPPRGGAAYREAVEYVRSELSGLSASAFS